MGVRGALSSGGIILCDKGARKSERVFVKIASSASYFLPFSTRLREQTRDYKNLKNPKHIFVFFRDFFLFWF